MRNEINAIAAIAYRDIMKFIRDPFEIVISFVFPIIFIGILGPSLQSNLSEAAGYSFIVFAFTGVIAQTVFQSTAFGIISLNEDRDRDLTQEIFVSPISRYSIIIGKIVGETADSILQALVLIGFGLLIRIPLTLEQSLLIIGLSVIISILGGTFGIAILSNLKTPRMANKLFPFVMFPQFFLAGVFAPIKELPLYLMIPSRIVPMTYGVDLLRSFYYWGSPEYDKVVLFSPGLNLAIIALYSLVFLVVGTFFFTRNERNR